MSEFIEVEEVVIEPRTVEELVDELKHQLRKLIDQVKEQRERVG